VRPRSGYTGAQAAAQIADVARSFVAEYKGEYRAEYTAAVAPVYQERPGRAAAVAAPR
jgi:hypothetical protein